jgi:MscS family membrane protein
MNFLWHADGSFLLMSVAGNPLWVWAAVCGVLLASLAVGRASGFFMDRWASGHEGRRPWLAVLLRALSRCATLLSFAVGCWLVHKGGLLDLAAGVVSVVDVVVRVLMAVAVGVTVYSMTDLADYALKKGSEKTASKMDDMLVPLVGKSIRITVMVIVVLHVIEAFSDKPVTTILAGLGVGGLAVALAGQDTIRNFFGSLVIVGDKPFEIGDRIVFDGYDGPVERVGFRSTRIRTLEGHHVTVPNSEMVNKSVQNIGKRPYIRRVANITITYDTPPAKVDRAVSIIKDILDGHEGMHPDFPPRVYFSDFNEWSLNLIMIYWYHPPDYWQYMAFSENVNHQILRRFNAEGIEFAFPTQTVHLNQARVQEVET